MSSGEVYHSVTLITLLLGPELPGTSYSGSITLISVSERLSVGYQLDSTMHISTEPKNSELGAARSSNGTSSQNFH